jgi:GAF domain-containing protein
VPIHTRDSLINERSDTGLGESASNTWVAIDAATSPTLRAQELRFAWELFLGAEDDGDPNVREPIADSWRRSLDAGVDPTGRQLAPVVEGELEVHDRYAEHPLGRHAPLVHACLAEMAEELGYLIVISDATGVLLSIEGSGAVRMRAAEMMNFTEGVLWSEPGAGTNAIGTAIAANHAVQVFGPEHFNEPVQRWTCSAAPIHDPDTGALLGVIDLTGDFSTVHPHSLAVATATAQAVETELRMELQEIDARLRARYGDRVASSPASRALVAPSGRAITALPSTWGASGRLELPAGGGALILPSGAAAVAEPVNNALEAFVVRAAERKRSSRRPLLTLSLLGRDRARLKLSGSETEVRPRLAEILALLCANPTGYSAEALCADLHGDGGSPGSVRVEVSRLRKLLGPWIDTERYRLTCDVDSDVRHIEGLLAAGRTRDAAELYPGPLLPSSEAPGVVRERERLDRWLRQAVMTSDDLEALWAWVQTPTGDDDLPAWKRLLAGLAFHDPRRARCAARVGELRADAATPM